MTHTETLRKVLASIASIEHQSRATANAKATVIASLETAIREVEAWEFNQGHDEWLAAGAREKAEREKARAEAERIEALRKAVAEETRRVAMLKDAAAAGVKP